MLKFAMSFSVPEYEFERRGPVLIWWFTQNFSQSRYGDRTNGSNACTLIALLVALRISRNDIKIQGHFRKPLNEQVIKGLAESFVEGNEIHELLLKSGELQHVNMTVPEAIQAAGKSMRSIVEWKSLVYLMDMSDSLFDQLNATVLEWYQNPPPNYSDNLFVIIIADNRSVLLVFQQSIEKVTLIDSHQHLNCGAVVAQVDLSELGALCMWYLGLIEHCYNVHPECYELSYLYFKRYEGVSEACTLICLLVAQRICQTRLLIWNVADCIEFNIIMAEAIVEGNTTHAWIVRSGLIPHPYLNTEEALQYGGKSLRIMKEWKFRVFHEDIKLGLYQNIESFLRDWYRHPESEYLFMLLITCGRTILFIFQEQTYKVTLFDSHGHSTGRNPFRGLVAAQVKTTIQYALKNLTKVPPTHKC